MAVRKVMRSKRGKPGEFFIPSLGKSILIVEWREDDLYDTIAIAGLAAIAAGTNFVLFRDLANKELIDTNLTTQRRVAAGEEAIINAIGVHIRSAVGQVVPQPQTYKQVAECAYLFVNINRKLVSQGPLIKYGSGYGLYGNTTEANQGICSIGVPSSAAVRSLRKVQELTANHDLDAQVQFFARTWIPVATIPAANTMPTLNQAVLVTCFMHGFIRSAATK